MLNSLYFESKDRNGKKLMVESDGELKPHERLDNPSQDPTLKRHRQN